MTAGLIQWPASGNPRATPGTVAALLVSTVIAWTGGPPGPANIPLTPGSYGLYELGTLGGPTSVAYDINNDSTIVGAATDASGNTYGFAWRDGVMTRLDPPAGGHFSDARAISAFNAAAGTAEQTLVGDDGKSRIIRTAVRWQLGRVELMDNPAGSEGPQVFGITAGGTLVGSVGTSLTNQDGSVTLVSRAVRWPGGRGAYLTSDPSVPTQAMGVSADGVHVVGHSRPAGRTAPLAALFTTDPPTLLHTFSAHLGSVALTANTSGVVAGYTFPSSLPTFYEPFFWQKDRGMWRPPLPAGAQYGQVMDLTESGLAVGAIRNAGVVLWLDVGQPAERFASVQGLLPRTAPRVEGPVAINDHGEITAVRVAGTTHAVLLYPTNRWRQVSGSLRTLATEHATNATGTFPTFTHAIDHAQIDLLEWRDGAWTRLLSRFTEDSGTFAFLFRPKAPGTRMALRVHLHDDDGWVDVLDEAADPSTPAWLRTPAFTTEGDTRIDLEFIINANPANADPNETEYRVNGSAFNVGPALAPPEDGASNSTAAHFAHLTIFYRNVRLAARFAKDRLGLPMPRMPVHAFEPRGTFAPWTLQSTSRSNVVVWTSEYDGASSFTRFQPLGLHFAAITSTYNQPALGIPGNTNGYFWLRVASNTTSRVTRAFPVVWGRERPDNREFHEYGHAIMFHSTLGGIDTPLPYLLNPVTGTFDRNHDGYLNSVSTDSWAEGFAEFISAMISTHTLDPVENPTPHLYRIQGSPFSLDSTLNYTNDIVHQPDAEELLVASLLWDLDDGATASPDDDGLDLAIDDWWSVMQTHGPRLLSLKNVYDAFHEFGIEFPFRLSPLAWDNRALDSALFDDRTFRDSRSGNGVFDAGEHVGATSWNPSFPGRFNARTHLWMNLDVVDEQGLTASDAVFDFHVRYDPPLDHLDHAWSFPTFGPASVALPFLPPAGPCTIQVSAQASGIAATEPLFFRGSDARASVNAIPRDGDGEWLTHQFVLPSRPKLAIALINQGTRIECSWPATSPPFSLEFTTNLHPPVAWGRPPGSPSRVGDRLIVTLPLPPGTVFLRLVRR